MKRISRRKLIMGIRDLHSFFSACEQAEQKEYNDYQGEEHAQIHFIKKNTYKFVKEYIQSNFRPLV